MLPDCLRPVVPRHAHVPPRERHASPLPGSEKPASAPSLLSSSAERNATLPRAVSTARQCQSSPRAYCVSRDGLAGLGNVVMTPTGHRMSTCSATAPPSPPPPSPTTTRTRVSNPISSFPHHSSMARTPPSMN
ncbi:hypothetical protein CALCODRAFT_284628 [Calocera cornea HHB12733]|uniref:Uncharacterized protein n=1 Tax=Calocera cornea HHB12733 TaxID=1353952 RepID=A0A165FZS7_9BASI|nr:hypothetical protein CALCODRAFT_284628 [Calocera cornea HHB12733]